MYLTNLMMMMCLMYLMMMMQSYLSQLLLVLNKTKVRTKHLNYFVCKHLLVCAVVVVVDDEAVMKRNRWI